MAWRIDAAASGYAHAVLHQVANSKRMGTADPRRRMPKQRFPSALEAEYAGKIVGILDQGKAAYAGLIKRLPALLARAEAQRSDAADEEERDADGKWTSGGAGAAVDHAARETSFANKLEPHEQDAVYAYSGRQYHEMNRLARTGSIHPGGDRPKSREKPAEIATHVKNLDSALAKMESTTHDMIVHRGSTAKALQDLKPGDEITDKGFMSTSLEAKTAHDTKFTTSRGVDGGRGEPGTKLTIHVPKGTKVSPLPTMLGEGEHLFPRGTKLRVTHASKDAEGYHVVHATVVK